MVGEFQVRTDLALEVQEGYEKEAGEIRGVRVKRERDQKHEIDVTTVIIDTENGARIMGKPVGTYITIEAPNLSVPDEGYHREVSKELAKSLRVLLHKSEKEILVVGLGNRDVTPDALGPEVIGNLCITRHMIKEYGCIPGKEKSDYVVSAIVPGVMAQTGMETLEIIQGVVNTAHPRAVIVIDALAARNTRRVNRTIQITDTGINPGSGVGNHRNAINQDSLGIPVIAIGVPTVVDAATIVNDTMEELVEEMDKTESMQRLGGMIGTLNQAEKHQMIRELISPHLNTMFVTPKDIDESIKYLSYTISEGLNMVFMNKKE